MGTTEEDRDITLPGYEPPMLTGQHNQIHATTLCTTWARAAHAFLTFGSPPSIFLSKKELVRTPKRFRPIDFCRNGPIKRSGFAAEAR